jgi:DNA-binding response OmpR family regulator
LTAVPSRVLVVEDSVLVTDALTILLESAGHEVRVAGTVARAVALGRAEPADVMLLDLSLPDGDGLEALAGLRAAGAEPPVTVALTGRDDARTVQRCRDAGCREVLLKPVPTRELLARVAGWAREAAEARQGTAGGAPGRSEPPL